MVRVLGVFWASIYFRQLGSCGWGLLVSCFLSCGIGGVSKHVLRVRIAVHAACVSNRSEEGRRCLIGLVLCGVSWQGTRNRREVHIYLSASLLPSLSYPVLLCITITAHERTEQSSNVRRHAPLTNR